MRKESPRRKSEQWPPSWHVDPAWVMLKSGVFLGKATWPPRSFITATGPSWTSHTRLLHKSNASLMTLSSRYNSYFSKIPDNLTRQTYSDNYLSTYERTVELWEQNFWQAKLISRGSYYKKISIASRFGNALRIQQHDDDLKKSQMCYVAVNNY